VNQVILLTGPVGAGKSSVAEAICERFDRMVHVDLDLLHHAVKAGYRHPWLDDPQAAEQRVLAVRNAAAMTREAIALRYAVVIDGIALAADAAIYRERLDGIESNVHFVLLLPTLEATLDRDAAREPSNPDRVRALHETFTQQSSEGALPGAVIDSTGDENAAMTADRVQDVVASGEALFTAGSA
jgi:adenylate kinase family enzyme